MTLSWSSDHLPNDGTDGLAVLEDALLTRPHAFHGAGQVSRPVASYPNYERYGCIGRLPHHG